MKYPEELTGLEENVYRNILQIRQHKRSRIHPSTRGDYKTRIVPDHALFIGDIMKIYKDRIETKELKAILNNLCRQGHLKFGPAGNDTYFEIVEKDEK